MRVKKSLFLMAFASASLHYSFTTIFGQQFNDMNFAVYFANIVFAVLWHDLGVSKRLLE